MILVEFVWRLFFLRLTYSSSYRVDLNFNIIIDSEVINLKVAVHFRTNHFGHATLVMESFIHNSILCSCQC